MGSYTLSRHAPLANIEAYEAAPPENLGSLEALKAQVARALPGIRWHRSEDDKPGEHYAWFGQLEEEDPFMIQLLVHGNAEQVCVVSLTCCEPSRAEELGKHLGLVVVDEERFIGA